MVYDMGDPEVRRVRFEVRRFKEHLIIYVAVIAVLFLANIVAGGFWYGHFWLFWIALIWGVMIALQGARLFGDDIGKDWEDRMVDHVLARRRADPVSRPAPTMSPRPQPSPPPRPQPSPPPRPTPSEAIVTPAPVASEPIVTPPPADSAGPPGDPAP